MVAERSRHGSGSLGRSRTAAREVRGSARGRSRRRPTGGSAPGGARPASCPRSAAVLGHRLQRVRRAGRVVAADLAVERADQRRGRRAAGRSGRTSRRLTVPGRATLAPGTAPDNGRGRRRVPRTTRRPPAGAPGPRARQPAGSDGEALPDQVAEPALDTVADDGVADGLAHHEPDPRRRRLAVVRRRAGAPPGCRCRRGGPSAPRAGSRRRRA